MSERSRHRTGTLIAVASAIGLATVPPLSANGLAATARASGTHTGTWRVQVSPNVTTPTGFLASVSCVRARACTAVGDYTTTAGLSATLAEAWNGTSWHRQPMPDPAGGSNFVVSGVSCTSSRFCQAVGDYIVRHGAAGLAFAEEWNGHAWRVLPFPAPADSRNVGPAAVSCASAHFCEAVGQYQNASNVTLPLAEVWNGTRWKQQPFPAPSGYQLNGVSCLSAKFCEAVAFGSSSNQDAAVWNGTSWSLQSTPVPTHSVGIALSAVSCVAVKVCEAVGNWLAPDGELPQAFTLAEVWNGKAWAIQHTPNLRGLMDNRLAGISCTSARFCTAVGNNFDPTSALSVSLAAQWNGVSWRLRSTPRTPDSSYTALNGVSCTARNACEAVGNLQVSFFVALAEAWDGHSWNIQPGVAPAGAINNFLNAVSCVTARFCEAVGAALDPMARYIALAERWNGTTWKIQPVPSPARLSNIRAFMSGVSCVSVRFCMAVGESNSLPGVFTEMWNGTSWKIRTAPGTGSLASVYCLSARFCLAVGGTGAMPGGKAEADLWNGHSWSAVPPAPGFTSLSSVSCVSARFCEAVGLGSSGSDAQVWNGSSWSHQSTPLPAGVSPQLVNFNGVSCTAANACEAVGGYVSGILMNATLAEAWDGTDWSIQHTPSPTPDLGPSLSSVWCTTATSCTAVGLIGQNSTASFHLTLAVVWDGTSWRVQRTPTPNQRSGGGFLNGVWCGASPGCVAVGDGTDLGGTPATLVEARH